MTRHEHIVGEDSTGRPLEIVEDSPIKAQTARGLLANAGGRIMRNVYCRQPLAHCQQADQLIGGAYGREYLAILRGPSC